MDMMFIIFILVVVLVGVGGAVAWDYLEPRLEEALNRQEERAKRKNPSAYRRREADNAGVNRKMARRISAGGRARKPNLQKCGRPSRASTEPYRGWDVSCQRESFCWLLHIKFPEGNFLRAYQIFPQTYCGEFSALPWLI